MCRCKYDLKMSAVIQDDPEGVLRKRKLDNISKKKHRRGKRRRKWKAYSEMSLEEKHELERREEERTAKMEAKLAKLGRPTAPFNSNTFLIEDREDTKTVEEHMLRFLKRSQSTNSPNAEEEVMDEVYESPEDSLSEEEELLERDFKAQYEEACRERFDELKKEDLVDECIKLEETLQRVEEDSRLKIAALESELTTLRKVAHASTDSNDLGTEQPYNTQNSSSS